VKERPRKQIADAVRAAVMSPGASCNLWLPGGQRKFPARWHAWLGGRRVIEFVEELIRIGTPIDPGALFSYATYPPTEYLLPQNADFCCFNVYLQHQQDFEGYLLRLQNLTGEHPLYSWRIRHGHHPAIRKRNRLKCSVGMSIA